MATRTTITILVADRDPNLRYALSQALEQEGYTTVETDSARSMLRLARQCRPAVVVLDSDLPDMNGFEACMRLRALPVVNHTPILFLSTRHSAELIARALDSGGDDFLRKPFAVSELRARVRALLRRSMYRSLYGAPVITLDEKNCSVIVEGRRVVLTPTEFNLLIHLCDHQAEHHTASSLLQVIWDYPPGGGDTALVRNHIRNLRRKIEANPDQPRIIVSQHGRGYTVNARVLRAG